MALWLIIIVAFITTSISAIPTIGYPLNSQIPTIARVSQPFIYTFPSSTFYSTSPINYSLSSGPNWLSLDGTTRTLSGTPSTSDVGSTDITEVAIGLTATDSSGSTTLNASLVVSTNPAPVVSIPPSAQLPSFGIFTEPATLLYHPSTPFDFEFDPGTFSPNGGSSNLSYYAMSDDDTPLPSWIVFDESSLSFSGQTPDYASLVQPPQTFGIRFIATDITDFAGTSIVFHIEVGVHLLSFNAPEMLINATAGDNITFDGLLSNLEVDGHLANTSEISSIDAQTPSWLTFDNSTLLLTGNAPSIIGSTKILVLAHDIYGDIANATILVTVMAPIFSKAIPDMKTTMGSKFSDDMTAYLRNSSDAYLVANFTPTSPWLSFDSTTFILSGQVPPTGQSSIKIEVTAFSKSSLISSSETFELSIVPATTSAASSTIISQSHTSKSVIPKYSTTAASAVKHAVHRLSTGVIVAIVTPILVVFLALLFSCFCYRHRRNVAKQRRERLEKHDISNPLEARDRSPVSSVEEIVLPPRVPTPDLLQLDTSGFSTDTHAVTANEKRLSSQNAPGQDLRRSRTTNSMIYGGNISRLSEPGSSEARVRSYSENALSQMNKTRSSGHDSAYHALRSSGTLSSRGLVRTYSNYSRKGHFRRSTQLSFTHFGGISRDGTTASHRNSQPILNLNDEGFSSMPLDSFSALSSHPGKNEPHKSLRGIERPVAAKFAIRQSTFGTAMVRRRSGIGHGGRPSSSISSSSMKSRSIGHGQEHTSSKQLLGFSRDSKTWLAVASAQEPVRQSNISVSSVYSDTYCRSNKRFSIRRINKSLPIASSLAPSRRISQNSQTSRSSRPVSRRIGSSPFFAGGSSLRDSWMSPRRFNSPFSDSQTVLEESPVIGGLENVVLHGPREEDGMNRDAFGISYGLARESTRQLRTYVGQLHHSKTKETLKSTRSRDSRFESAAPSIQSLHQDQHPAVPTSEDDEYEHYLPDGFSEGSWETDPPSCDSQGNAIEYNEGESPGVMTTYTQPSGRPNLVLGPRAAGRSESKSFATPAAEMDSNTRLIPGRGRRPISVDANFTKGSVRVRVEGGESDYSAYI